MKDLRPIRGKYYIADLISQGEHECQDFKFSISDPSKIARSISAFANNKGGRLLIGVKDNGVVAGVRNEEDIFVVEQAASLYCRPEVTLEFTAFRVDGGLTVIRAVIPEIADRPVQAREPDGRWRAYYRVADENIVASPLMVKSWQLARDNNGILLTLSQAERTVLTLLESNRPMTVEMIMEQGHTSRITAEAAVVRLAALRMVKFVYTGGGVRIAAMGESEMQ